MQITIREYQDTDRTQIIKWIESLHDYLVKIDPDKRLRRQPEYGDVFTQELFDFIREGQGKIYIAVDGQKYVGFIAGAVDKQSDKNLLEVVPTKLGVVSEFFVEEKYRGQGVGKVLMEKLETYFKSIDCDSLWANVVAFNPAHDVYEKMGYHDREIGMLKKL